MTKFNRIFLRLWPYLWQLSFILVFMTLVLFAFGTLSTSVVLGAIGASSLGATCFILFATPESDTAKVRHVWGGYIIGISAGVLCHYGVSLYADLPHVIEPMAFHGLCAAFAIVLASIGMAVFRLSHPPAIGMSLGLVLEQWDHWTLIIVFTAVVILSITKKLLHDRIKSLA
jgi:CBS-domain-containing membrane protein